MGTAIVVSANEREGIGGWLALLILWMVVLRPLAGIVLWQEMHAANAEDPEAVARSSLLVSTTFFWIVFLCLAALNIYGGVRLWRDRSFAAVRCAIAILWIAAPIAIGALIIAQAYLTNGVTLADAATRLGTNVAAAAAWTAYLLRSKRVRNTYSKEAI